jgi:hypothetical protein
VRYFGWWLYGWKENGIHAIYDIKHEGRIYWVSDGEGHGDETQQTWVNPGDRKTSEMCATLSRLSRTKMTGTAEECYELITRGLQEVLGADIIKAILAEGRAPKCYWGQSFDQ